MPRSVLIVNLDDEPRIVHASEGDERDLGWYHIDAATQALLRNVPVSPAGLDLTIFTPDCEVISRTGYPTTSDQGHSVVIDRGEVVLEPALIPRPTGDLREVAGCDT